MKKYILLFFTAALLICNSAKAQVNLSIVIDSAFTIPNDTFNLGTSQVYNVWVKNSGTVSFNPTFINPLTIYTAVRDTANASILNIVNTDTTHAIDTIAAGDSIYVSLTANFIDSSAGYHKDINVIVIWPYASSVASIDSLEFPIFLVDASGIGEIDLNDIISVFPNPTTDYLSFENQSRLGIEEVRIMDAQGHLINHLKNPTKIETKAWAKGMYLLQVIFDNHQSKTIRILKQ